MARNLGVASLSMFCRVPYGGGADAGVVMYAALAVASGVADVVVCYRAMNERSGTRSRRVCRKHVDHAALPLVVRASRGTRHGGSSLPRRGWRSVPGGTWMRTASPTRISLPSRWLTRRTLRATLTPGSTDVRSLPRTTKHRAGSSSPCSVSSIAARRAAGGVALVVTTSERARGLRQVPAVVAAAVQGATFDGEMMTSYYRTIRSACRRCGWSPASCGKR